MEPYESCNPWIGEPPHDQRCVYEMCADEVQFCKPEGCEACRHRKPLKQ